MDDIAPALIDQVNKAFKKEYETSPKIKRLLDRINSPTATYQDANEYAEEVGDILKRAFEKYVSSDALPDGKMYYNIADRLLRDTLGNNYELIADATDIVQDALNAAANIGLRSVRPELDEERLKNLIDRIANEEYYDDIRKMIEEALVNYSQSIVDDAVKANADRQYKAGLRPKIVRKAEAKACPWCRALEGEYDYETIIEDGINDVFHRHDACRCTTYYYPADGRPKKNVLGA